MKLGYYYSYAKKIKYSYIFKLKKLIKNYRRQSWIINSSC